jgi:RHS repeat-associated protein
MGDGSERLQFTGHERDAGYLDYMHARYYSAADGRFLSVDPAQSKHKSAGGWGRYVYGRLNPLRLIDPDGEDEVEFGGRTFEIYPGEAFIVRGYSERAGRFTGYHIVAYVKSGEQGEMIVVDSSGARNSKVTDDFSARIQKMMYSDNTGNRHLPNNLKQATVNGRPYVYSPENGAVAVGVVPLDERVTPEEVVEAAAGIEMYHTYKGENLQCYDFIEALGEKLNVEYPRSENEELFLFFVDSTREITE